MKKVVVALLVALALVGVPGRAVVAQGKSDTAPSCSDGNHTAWSSAGSEHRSGQATVMLDKVYLARCLAGDV